MSERSNVVPFEVRQILAIRSALGGERPSARAHRNAVCRRHGCAHVGADHLDIRVGSRPHAWGACRQCGCPGWIAEPLCDPAAPIAVLTAASGIRYERCACGAVRAIAPDVDPDTVAWSWPEPIVRMLEQLLVEDDG